MLKSAHTPTNQGRRTLQQRQKIGGGLFIAHQQLAEAVEPRVRAFDHPAARTLPFPAGADFFSALSHMRRVTTLLHNLRGGTPRIALVRTQVLPAAAGFGAQDHNAVQSDRQQFDIMPVGPADDKGQRDASTVHQQAALAAFFSPDPLGCCPPLPAPVALCLVSHQCFATPRQSPPFHHTRPNRPAIRPGRIPVRASVENVYGWRWRSQMTSAGPSTGNRCAAHRQCRRRFDGRPTACARRPDAVDNAGVSDVPGLWAPKAERVARVHQKLPTIEFWPCRQHNHGFKAHNYYLRISSKPCKYHLTNGSPACFIAYTGGGLRADENRRVLNYSLFTIHVSDIAQTKFLLHNENGSSHLVDNSGNEIAPIQMGGASGSPIFSFDQDLKLWLAGVVCEISSPGLKGGKNAMSYEMSDGDIYATYADFVQSDGTIRVS